ncbi:hypothetical protein [Hyphomicrobium sp.]|uniref:hypothetical protein n=1 Tax=Hyphomicrobium sp. TaxID=82 RepID=UPI002E2FDD71|nr:hypothetical protein [Hyphomicrobium sp.]HEX2842840.1 hypothetical protein [Hyphomicrobium sp.]
MTAVKQFAGVALAISAGAGAAMAAGSNLEASGRIEHLNPRGHHITVGNETYRYDPRLTGTPLRRGESVRVVYRERRGLKIALQILPAA